MAASFVESRPMQQKDLCRTKLPALVPRKRAQLPSSTPLPESYLLPEPFGLSSRKPQAPTRYILSARDQELFVMSSTRSLILAFVFSLCDSCREMKISSIQASNPPSIITNILAVLDQISDLVTTNPPSDQGASRFGNPAFRDFIDAVTSKCPDYHTQLGLPDTWILELSPYLENAFGSRQRIDYGSGHELNFAMWLLCLNRLAILPPNTFSQVGLVVFPRYIDLMRTIQAPYYLEPAGSHGVWGLDDYQFLPFLFGASQLSNHAYITPRGIHNDVLLEEEGDDYLYLNMIRYTVSTKTVKGLKWTQPMLDDISGVRSWSKVEQGMKKMFDKEVLGKLPIMQHFLFGSLIPAAPGMTVDGREDADANAANHGQVPNGPGHVHRDDTWGDCCGIKIPSTVAAGLEARKNGNAQALRRVPFD